MTRIVESWIELVTQGLPTRERFVHSMGDNLAQQFRDVEFVKPCNLCPHMKRITLGNIRAALEDEQHEVHIDPLLAERARAAVERMLAIA